MRILFEFVQPLPTAKEEGEEVTKRSLKLFVLLCAAAALLGCSPPMDISIEGRSIVIDLQSLGEYPSDVAGLRLIEADSKEVIWELKESEHAQLGRIELKLGENPLQPIDVRHGSYDVVTPTGATSFTLVPKTRYVAEAWSGQKGFMTLRTKEFVTPGA